MLVCCTKQSSLLNLDLFWKQVFSYICLKFKFSEHAIMAAFNKVYSTCLRSAYHVFILIINQG